VDHTGRVARTVERFGDEVRRHGTRACVTGNTAATREYAGLTDPIHSMRRSTRSRLVPWDSVSRCAMASDWGACTGLWRFSDGSPPVERAPGTTQRHAAMRALLVTYSVPRGRRSPQIRSIISSTSRVRGRWTRELYIWYPLLMAESRNIRFWDRMRGESKITICNLSYKYPLGSLCEAM
jgi:hypothetical protein